MTRRKTLLMLTGLGLASIPPAWTQTTDLAPVVSRSVSRTTELPGEFQPFLSVALHAKVAGYVERVLVDRGSTVTLMNTPEPTDVEPPELVKLP